MVFPNKRVHPAQGSRRTFPFVRSGPERDSGHGSANGGGGRCSLGEKVREGLKQVHAFEVIRN